MYHLSIFYKTMWQGGGLGGDLKMAFLCHFCNLDARRGMAKRAVFWGSGGVGSWGSILGLFDNLMEFGVCKEQRRMRTRMGLAKLLRL